MNQLAKIKLILIDVDGVLTDGKLTFDEKGNEYKSFNIKDGLRINLAKKAGLRIIFISGRRSFATQKRAKELGCEFFQKVTDKLTWYSQFKKEQKFKDEQVLFIGDDLNDLPLLSKVGVSATPFDATPEVKEKAKLVSQYNGGGGAVGEIITQVLKAQNKWGKW